VLVDWLFVDFFNHPVLGPSCARGKDEREYTNRRKYEGQSGSEYSERAWHYSEKRYSDSHPQEDSSGPQKRDSVLLFAQGTTLQLGFNLTVTAVTT